METARPVKIRHVLDLLDLRLAAGLGALTLASAVTEGIGLIMLVPMLAALGGGAGSERIVAWLASAGLPVALAPMLAIFCALVLVRAVLTWARTYAAARLEMHVIDRLRARTWAALLHCDWRTFSAMRQSDNTSMLVNNIDRVGEGLNQLMAIMAFAVTLAGVGGAALAISPRVALAAGIAAILVLAGYRRLRRRAASLGHRLGAAYREVHGRLSEGLRSIRVIKSFGLEDDAAASGIASIETMRAAQLAYLRDQGLGQVALQGGGAIMLALGVWLATTRGGAGIAEILPLAALAVRGLPLLGAIQESWQNWEHCKPAIADAMALVERAEAAREPDFSTSQPPTLANDLSFSGVGLRFAGSDTAALSNIDLTIPAGTCLALVGPSGAGKSTLADLAGGLLAPDSGTVRIDGAVLEGSLRRAWRSRVAYVQQEALLFAGSIRSNLTLAKPDASAADLAQALADASAQFVNDLPQGLDTLVGDGGRRLSGGEQQRISLARNLLRKPDLLILDEATSALDAANEAVVAQAIEALKGRLTILVIGHRGTLIGLADRVVEIAEGRLQGSHTPKT